MINSGLGTFLALLLLILLAAFGYYHGFLALLTRKAILNEQRRVKGGTAIALGFLQLLGAVVASAVAILFYFSQVS
ncbi:MAG TPA: hypothetical protein VH186_30315 [Chloroflexia bacterium]|nr:hypothetical protein [Chloroflexia bacterium]